LLLIGVYFRAACICQLGFQLRSPTSLERRGRLRERCVLKKRLDHLIDVLSLSSDEHSIRLALLTFAQQCGFEKFAYVNLRYGDTEAFSNYPQEWQEIYLANDYQRIDPVVTASVADLA